MSQKQSYCMHLDHGSHSLEKSWNFKRCMENPGISCFYLECPENLTLSKVLEFH